MKKFKLHYYVENGGDGSANTQFCASEDEATSSEETAIEEGMDGWGEPSVGSLTLAIKDDVICFLRTSWDGKKHNETWVPLVTK